MYVLKIQHSQFLTWSAQSVSSMWATKTTKSTLKSGFTAQLGKRARELLGDHMVHRVFIAVFSAAGQHIVSQTLHPVSVLSTALYRGTKSKVAEKYGMILKFAVLSELAEDWVNTSVCAWKCVLLTLNIKKKFYYKLKLQTKGLFVIRIKERLIFL